MTIFYACDYCGEPITGLLMTLKVDGDMPSDGRYFESRRVCGWIGHYHSEAREAGAPSCYRRVLDAIDLAHAFGPTLENAETLSSHQLAARRRKHHRGGEA